MIFKKRHKRKFINRAILMFCSIVVFLFSHSLYAQREYDHDITLGYGVVTTNQIFDVSTDVLASVVSLGAYTSSGSQYYGGFSINYKNTLSKHWNAGITFSYDKVTKDVHSLKEKRGDLNRDYYTIAGEVDFRYFKKEIFQMYSLAGLGYTFIRDRYMPIVEEKIDKGASGFMNFHVSLLGIRLGRELAFYTELGIGYKGILSFGVSYQF